jgi:hypothetical protein
MTLIIGAALVVQLAFEIMVSLPSKMPSFTQVQQFLCCQLQMVLKELLLGSSCNMGI